MSTKRKCVYENSWILLKSLNGEIDLKWLQNKYERDKYNRQGGCRSQKSRVP